MLLPAQLLAGNACILLTSTGHTASGLATATVDLRFQLAGITGTIVADRLTLVLVAAQLLAANLLTGRTLIATALRESRKTAKERV